MPLPAAGGVVACCPVRQPPWGYALASRWARDHGWMDAPAVVVAYDQRWPQLFESLRERVDAALGGVPHVTVHVGSTAVPGLDAKPIIDLDVVVPGPAVVADAVAALAGAGWRHEGDLGIAGREAYLSGKAGLIAELLRAARRGRPGCPGVRQPR